MDITTTSRGFARSEFFDRYGARCSIQKSSLATEDCLWLGVEEVNGDPARMHLTQAMAAALLPLLQGFVATGELHPIRSAERFLDLSTAHLSPEARAWLSECGTANHAANYHGASDGGPISTLGTTMCGWFMHAPDEEDGKTTFETMPADLVAICRKARASDCAYILFDRDADALDDLPIFPDD